MTTALFNPPNPKNWIYILILFSALLIISILNGCKARQVSKSNIELRDKTEIKTEVIKKDSLTDMSKKTDILNIKKERVENIENNTYTEIETTYFKPDSVTPANSIAKIVTKIKSNNKGNNTSKLELNNNTDTFTQQTKTSALDSSIVERKDIVKIEAIKNVEVKDNSIRMWIGFAIFLIAIGFALILYFRYR